MDIKRRWIAALFAGTLLAPAAYAADNTLADCVDLSPDREIVRAGGSQSFLLRDGDEHYLVSFRSTCGSIATTSKIEIQTDGTPNRLCAKDSKVRTSSAICPVGKVEILDSDQFAMRRKRAAR